MSKENRALLPSDPAVREQYDAAMADAAHAGVQREVAELVLASVMMYHAARTTRPPSPFLGFARGVLADLGALPDALVDDEAA
ncbi:MAG TPA: hypothetical protein VGC13_22265 [Longimicrobium sp.]|jgi:hypothetical protein|uniref:hypothetical protein n=1 Tax=Longimicrobium sp. TaxID=2029185 RepID=UPI002ED99537